VTLVVGDEELLVARAVQRSIDAVAVDGAVEVRDVTAAEVEPLELAEMTSPSLFGDPRAVVVRAVQDATKELGAALAALAADPPDDVAIIAVHAGGAKAKRLIDELKGAGARVVEAPRVKSPRDREQFVVSEVGAAGGSIETDAVTDLLAAVGTDLRELATACAQLVADVGKKLTADNIAAYFRGRMEYTGFTVADRAVEGDAAGALETLRWAFATGVDPVLISAALASNLRTIALVAAAGRGSPDAVAGRVGMPAWKVRRAQSWAKRWQPDALAGAVQAVADADAGIKGAGDDAAFAAEWAVLAVAGAVRQ
jgi:DNA polymerase-3 subunit delta